MAKLRLYPSVGTLNDAKKLKFEITDVGVKSFRVHMENATHGTRIDVSDFHDMGDGSHMGIINLNIPPHFSQSAISIFAHIEKKQENGSYATVQICPSIFAIKEETPKGKDSITVSPSFISPDDLCLVEVGGEPNSKAPISINDKIFQIRTDEGGNGSIHFKGSDIMGGALPDTVCQFPIYSYNAKDNYTKKIFSGSYINILPATIAMHAAIDPRCDIDNTTYYLSDRGVWVEPPECDITKPPIVGPPLEPEIPPTALPTVCNEEDIDIHDDVCKVFGSAAVMLNGGVSIHSYISPDKTYEDSEDDRFNINRVFLAKQPSSMSEGTITTRDVAIEPKAAGEDFRIHVENDLWQSLVNVDDTSATDIYVVLFSEAIGFQRIKIVERIIEEYTDSTVLIGEMTGDNLQISSWIFCVNAVFYHASFEPSTYLPSVIEKLPYIIDANGNYVQIVNISVATNVNYVDQYEDTYVYIVVEGMVSRKSQLFLFTIRLPIDLNRESSSYGWKQLTNDNNNQNPKISMTGDHNLHVIWESDREDSIKQLYYGILGLSHIPSGVAALSSFVDKYSEFLASGEEPFDYLTTVLTEAALGDEYNPIPEYDSESLVNLYWDVFTTEGGRVAQTDGDNYIRDLYITVDPVLQEAIAFNHLQIVDDIDDPSALGLMPYSQYNYQVSFKLSASVAQESVLAVGTSYEGVMVDSKDIDDLYNTWKGDFVTTVESGIDNQPVYVKNSNRYIIGRRDSVFDRIVPLVGSYEYDGNPLDPSANPSMIEDTFQIRIMKNDSNLKDFTLGLMLEKSFFTATNMETSVEYDSHGYSDLYWPSENHTIYSGRAKLVALIKTEETTDESANYIIVREFPEAFDISTERTYTIMINYTSIDSNEVTTTLDTYGQNYTDKFMGVVTLVIDGVPRFSQSFVSTLTADYNYFDIGFGVPYGGYYVADKMAPSKLGVFDDALVTMSFTDISITSPTLVYNDEVINAPYTLHKNTSLRVQPEVFVLPWPGAVIETLEEDSSAAEASIGFREADRLLYSDSWGGTSSPSTISFDVTSIDRLDFSVVHYLESGSNRLRVETQYGFEIFDSGYFYTRDAAADMAEYSVNVSSLNNVSVILSSTTGTSPSTSISFYKIYNSNTFLQVPLTISGINQSADICNGNCNDVHVAWQSNRDRYWDIFYSNSSNKLSPFRRNTRITDTNSNSLKPSISVSRNGSRLVSWHDNRNENFEVFVGRSLDGYACDEDKCKRKILDAFESEIVECTLSATYSPSIIGTYNFAFEFYRDASLTDLYKDISIGDAPSRWFINGGAIESFLEYNADGTVVGYPITPFDDITVSYIPDKDDDIFDMVLYANLTASVT